MHNLDLEHATVFHQASKIASGSGLRLKCMAGAPPKAYRGLRGIELAREQTPDASDTLHAMASTVNDDAELDFATLSQLLGCCATMLKQYTNHNRHPCCPLEIYLVNALLPDLSAGIYHFDREEMSLKALRSGDYRPDLVATAGDNQAIAAAPATVVVCAWLKSNVGGNAARAYRYSLAHIGMLVAGLLAVASAHNVPASVEMSFVDPQLNHLLGLDGASEAALCLVPLGRGIDWAEHASERDLPGLSVKAVKLADDDADVSLQEIHDCSSLASNEETRPLRGPCLRPRRTLSEQGMPLRLSQRPSLPLGEVITAALCAGFERAAIQLEELSALLYYSTRSIEADFLEGPDTSLLDAYLVVHSVSGLDSGIYFFSPEEKRLQFIQSGEFRQEVGRLLLEPSLAADGSTSLFLLSDLPPVLRRFGNRGYRLANLEAGIIAGRLSMAAASLGLGTVWTDFLDDDTARFFSPHGAGLDPLMALVIGRPRV